MKNKYGLSIIIPAYNEEKIINKCLEAVYKIKKLNLDVIVIDDGSKDRTATIVSKYPCKLIKNKENIGAGLSKNKAIKFAKFNYILIIDANAIVIKDAIEKMFFYLKSKKNLFGKNGILKYQTSIKRFFLKVQAIESKF